MEINDETDHFMNTYPPVDKYIQQLSVIRDQQPSLFSEFINVFVRSKMYPSNQEIQQSYQNAMSSIANVKNELATVSKDLQSNITNLNTMLIKINALINQERNINNQLKKQMKHINNEQYASNELITDYKEMYNMKYLNNWSIVLCIVIVFGMTYSIVPKNTTTTMVH